MAKKTKKATLLRPVGGNDLFHSVRPEKFIEYYENLLKDPSLDLATRRHYESCLEDWKLDAKEIRMRSRGLDNFDSGNRPVYTGNADGYYTGDPTRWR